jgi:hypothetical protein
MGDFMKPTQSRPSTTQTDPFRDMRPQAQFAENALRGSLGASRAGEIGNPYVGPSAAQQATLGSMQNYLGQAMPAFNQGARELERVAAGAYLDPTKAAPYQQFKSSQMALAPMLFEDTANQLAGRSIARGGGGSSLRLQQAQAAGEIGGGIGQKVAGAGWEQYGRERGLQEAAAARGMTLAPGLAQQLFGQQETLRAAQQQANMEQLRGRLQAMGLQSGQIESLLKYLNVAAGRPAPYVQGPSGWQELNSVLSMSGEAYPGFKSAIGSTAATPAPSSSVMGPSMGYWV